MQSLKKIFKELHWLKESDSISDQKVSSVTQDSRTVGPHTVFFALKGSDEQKKAYINQAQDKGASLIVHDLKDLNVGVCRENIYKSYTAFLKAFYKDSVDNLKIYGVTGTNGKTTYAYMLKYLLEVYDSPTGVFGTIENSFKDKRLKTDLTSPTADDFYAFNHENYKLGMKTVVCEVSSHALDQKRMGVDFLDGAAFTSFSQDHLDYHSTMESYKEAKAKVFTEALKKGGFKCVTEQVPSLYPKESDLEVLNGDNYQIDHKVLNEGLEITFTSLKKEKSLTGFLPIFGGYNAENFGLALMTLCKHFGDEFFPDERVFENFKAPPGRMEPFFYKDKPLAFVDFSHTPDSLEKSLMVLKNLKKDIYCVFGCGGDRDKGKRKLMGEVADRLSTKVFITSDNPRSEEPLKIVEDIEEGMLETPFEKETDRKKAILKALEEASSKEAIVLIAGKGHETTQEIQGVKKHFSDQEVVLNWLKDK